MRPLIAAFAFALAGCAASGSGASSDPPPPGSWRGVLAPEAGGPAVPATLAIGADGGVELVAGAARVRADDVAYELGRLRFRAPQFPITRTEHRNLRCDLSAEGMNGLRGSCRAGNASYRLALRPSSSL